MKHILMISALALPLLALPARPAASAAADQPTLSIGDTSVDEGDAGTVNAAFGVTLSPASTNSVKVRYSTAGESAAAGTDFVGTSGTVVFAPGETSKTISVAVVGDTEDEPDETFLVNLGMVKGGAAVGDGGAIGTIIDDDLTAPTEPTLSIAGISVTEGDADTVPAAFEVTRAGDTSGAVTVDYATANGTAEEPGDYIATDGTLTFEAGETTKTIEVAVAGDDSEEPTETFTVTLSNPTGGATIAGATATGTIVDDDSPGASKPNILVLLTDDQSPHSLPLMPYLSSRPYGNWTEFTNAFVNTPICCPARATNLTGQYSHHTTVTGNGSGSRFQDAETVAVWLDRAGYRTGLFGKYLNGYPFDRGDSYIPPGWDEWFAKLGSTTSYYNYDLNENGTVTSYGKAAADYQTDLLNDKALDFVNADDPDPFFALVSYPAPHYPTAPAPRHKNSYSGLPVAFGPAVNEADVSDKPAWVQGRPLVGEATLVDRRRDEAKSLLAVDESIRDLMEALETRGELDDTVIVFLTDNGFSIGEHRWMNKFCVYEECVRTPLLVRYPAGTGGTDDRLVSNVDLAATLAELGGATAALPQDGRSWTPLLDGTATDWRQEILLEKRTEDGGIPGYWAVRTSLWKYVELDTGERELYDLVADPHELDNRHGQPGYEATTADLAARLETLRE